MKVVKVTQNSLEIGHIRLTESSLTLGRSPTCDFVFRAKGIKPVHFLIEWMGVGDFDPNSGHWNLFDISKSQQSNLENSSVEGVILSDNPTEVGGFQFVLSIEKLAETQLSGRVLKEAYFDEALDAELAARVSKKIPALEMVDVHLSSDAIVNISHFPRSNNTNAYKGDLPVNVKWNMSEQQFLEIGMPDAGEFKVFSKGEPLHIAKNAPLKLNRGDLYQIRWNDHDYFLRIVDWIAIEKSKKQILQDPIFKISAIVLGVLIAFGLYILNDPNIQTKEPPKPPPRIAMIEVAEAPKEKPPEVKPPEPKPPEKPKEPDPIPEKKKPVPPVIKQEVKKKAPDGGAKAAAPKVTKEKELPPKAGLNNLSKKADVNAVGLLGSMKKSKPTTISADQVINDGIVSDLAANSAPSKVVIQQSAAGIIGANPDKKAKSSGGLGGASSTLQGVEAENPNSRGALAIKGGTGEGLGQTLSGKLKNSMGSGDGMTDKGLFSESVSGGLDKEQIRKALAEHKREIRACYEKALIVKSKIAGRISYKWHISPQGGVTSVQVVKTEVGLPQLEDCVGTVIKGIQFPQSPNKQPTTVIYPFVFQSGNG